eukprot:SAG31_NODE_888_length_11219_cov_5.584712_5_plen_119_part_00
MVADIALRLLLGPSYGRRADGFLEDANVARCARTSFLSSTAISRRLFAYLRVMATDYKFHITYFGDNSHGYVKATSVVLYSDRNLSELVKEGKVKGTKARAAALAEVARAAAEGGRGQ